MINMSLDFNKCIIIGAPRSGTNMLRDVLCRLRGVSTWPCDEINYIWRHGNVGYPSDEFPRELARQDVCRYIRRQFNWVAQRYQADMVIEKTCANSLRVDFVNEVIPEARYIFIRRNGLDAVASAIQRWTAKLDWTYTLQKVRYVPLMDLPYYAVRHLASHIYRLFSNEGRQIFWGPQFNGMKGLLSTHPLDEVCAFQWKRCVDSAAVSFSTMPRNQWLEVTYEDFVRAPDEELSRILDFLGIEADKHARQSAVSTVRAGNIGKGHVVLDQERLQRLETLIHDTMERYGYA